MKANSKRSEYHYRSDNIRQDVCKESTIVRSGAGPCRQDKFPLLDLQNEAPDQAGKAHPVTA